MSSALSRPARPGAVRLTGVAAALALGAGLTGCGAGFEAQTYQERPTADAANAAAGTIAVRNLSVLPGEDGLLEAGADAEAQFTLTNDGPEADRLLSVSTPAASSVEIVSADEPDRALSSLQLPALGTTGSTYRLLLRSLAEDLRAGEYVEMTLRFERGGELVLQVPVAVTGEYDQDRERSGNFHPPGSEGHGGESGGESGGEGGGEGGEGSGGLSEVGEEQAEG